jgi:putative ABC transport system permease protein
MQVNFKVVDANTIKLLETKLSELSGKTNVNAKDKIAFSYVKGAVRKEDDKFVRLKENEMLYNRDSIKLLTLKSYNAMEGRNEKLEDKEVLVYSAGQDFGFDNVMLGNEKYSVKKELKEAVFEPKATANRFSKNYYLIVKDENAVNNILNETGNSGKKGVYSVQFNLAGEEKDKKEFASLLVKWVNGQKELISFSNGFEGREETVSMYGGLLFLGVFFGIVFSMCLLLIMYYKQITEGYDDRDNFSIMQKVGMSDLEVRGTIKRQILLVFFLPLLFAVFHTMAGFGMISELLGTLFLFNRTLIIATAIIVSSIFAVLYGLCYILTSKVYYKLVRQMN